MMTGMQIRAQIEWFSGADLSAVELIKMRRSQNVSFWLWRQAEDAWRRECATKRWWQRKPQRPSIFDFGNVSAEDELHYMAANPDVKNGPFLAE